jgi:hypothetical protein
MSKYYQYKKINLLSNIGFKLRTSIFKIFLETMRPSSSDKILDIGVSPDTRHESNYFESLYPYKNMLFTISTEDASSLVNIYPGLTFIRASGTMLPFKDDAFDIVFSSAVVEHVGGKKFQKKFIEETVRVGKKSFIITPNRRFPIEFHTLIPFIHYLPKKQHRCMLNFLGFKFYSKEENLNLLTEQEFKSLFNFGWKVKIVRYKLLFFTANLIAIVQKNNQNYNSCISK